MFLAVTRPSYNLQSTPSKLSSCLYESIKLEDLSIFAQDPKPCLVATSRNILKSKRVVFADDKGLPLTQVRFMKEPSSCPPRWTKEYLDKLTGINSRTESLPSSDPLSIWEPAFQQPVSDYLQFRSRLDALNVSLENLLVLEHDQTISGTVKVKNLSYKKSVKVRITFDGWKSFEDIHAVHVPANSFTVGAISSVSLYDTFSFKIKVPDHDNPTTRIEVCICFSCDHGEFWDNNFGQNYVFLKRKNLEEEITNLTPNENDDMVKTYKCNDALAARFDNWSEFASWSHLINDGPYW